MYKITTRDGAVLYDVSYPDDYIVTEPKATLEVGQPGSVQFSLVPEHPLYGTVKTMETYVCALKENTEFFYGRIIDINVDKTTGIKQIECAGALQFLEDGELHPITNPSPQEGEDPGIEMTASQFFSRVISDYNEDIGNDAKRVLTVGTVSHSKASETKLYNITSYTQAKSALESNLISEYGGYFRIRKSGNNHLIDWLEDYGEPHTSPIQIAENVINQENALSANDFITKIRPVGKNNLMLPEVTIPLSSALVNKYGSIIQTVTFGDAETEADLRSKANEYISRIGKGLGMTATIKVVDLHFLDNTVPAIRMASTYTNISGFEGEEMVVAGMELNFANPANDTVTLKNKKELIATQRGGTTGRGTLSKATEQGRNGPQGFQNIWKHITETEDSLRLSAELIEINAGHLVELANLFERYSEETTQTITFQGNQIDAIQGTGVLQNSDGITQVAGLFTSKYVLVPVSARTGRNPHTAGWFEAHSYTISESDVNTGIELYGSIAAALTGHALNTQRDLPSMIGQTVTRMVPTADTTPVEGKDYYTKGLSVLNGTGFSITENGAETNVGELISSVSKGVGETAEQIEFIEGSALWTYRDHITGVCGEYEIHTDAQGNRTLVIVSGGGIKIRKENTEFGLYDQDNLTGGIVVDKINENDTHTKILGTKVDIVASQVKVGSTSNVQAWMNETGQDIETLEGLVADKATIGELNALSARIRSIEADYISASELQSMDLYVENLYTGAGNFTEIHTLDINGYDPDDFLANATVTGTGANKTLHIFNAAGTEVATFTKAASQTVTLSGAWSGSTFTVSASPGDDISPVSETFSTSKGTGDGGSMGGLVTLNSFSGHKAYALVTSTRMSGPLYRIVADATSEYNSGRSSVTISDISIYGSPSASATSINVKATASNGQSDIQSINIEPQRRDAYNSGSSYGHQQGDPISGTVGSLVANKVHNFVVNRRDSTQSTIQIDCSSIYAAAREGYTLGTFTQATVTLQGNSVSVKPISTTSVRLGTKATYYKGDGGSFTPQGNSVTAYKKLDSGGTVYYQAGTATTYYNAGSSATYYNAGTSTVEARGGAVTVTPIGSAYGFTYMTIYNSSGTAMGSRWVSNGTGGASTMYTAGSAVTYYRGNGGTKTVQGSAVTVTKQGSSVSVTPIKSTATVRIGTATVLYNAGSGTKYDRGATVSGYPVVSSGGNVYYLAGATQTYYEKGTTDSDTYWTKS